MSRRRAQRVATVGVAEIANSAFLVTLAHDGTLLDRRQVALTGRDLPTHPHHHEIAAIAIRACPRLPLTVEERIIDNRAQTMADSILYREALATAAAARHWSVRWYERETVFGEAATALGREDIGDVLRALGRSIGPPWQAKHRLAAAAALAATRFTAR